MKNERWFPRVATDADLGRSRKAEITINSLGKRMSIRLPKETVRALLALLKELERAGDLFE